MHPIRILLVTCRDFPNLTVRSATRRPEMLIVDSFDCALRAYSHAAERMDQVPGKRYYDLLILDLDVASRDACHTTPLALAEIIRLFNLGIPLVFITGNPERTFLVQGLDEPKRTIVCSRSDQPALERRVQIAVDELLPPVPQPTL